MCDRAFTPICRCFPLPAAATLVTVQQFIMDLTALRLLEAKTAAHVAQLKLEWKETYNRSYNDPNPQPMTIDEALAAIDVMCAEFDAADAVKAVLQAMK